MLFIILACVSVLTPGVVAVVVTYRNYKKVKKFEKDFEKIKIIDNGKDNGKADIVVERGEKE